MSQNRFWKIVFPEPRKWRVNCCEKRTIEWIKRKKEKLISSYKGQIKNKKAHGKGVEILLSPYSKITMERVEEYYSGNWKNGKRHGKGIWYNYHPKIGQTGDDEWPLSGSFLYTVQEEEDDGDHSYDGEWQNGKRHGKGESIDFEGIFKGEFKNDKKWNGILDRLWPEGKREVEINKKIIKNGKLVK